MGSLSSGLSAAAASGARPARQENPSKKQRTSAEYLVRVYLCTYGGGSHSETGLADLVLHMRAHVPFAE